MLKNKQSAVELYRCIAYLVIVHTIVGFNWRMLTKSSMWKHGLSLLNRLRLLSSMLQRFCRDFCLLTNWSDEISDLLISSAPAVLTVCLVRFCVGLYCCKTNQKHFVQCSVSWHETDQKRFVEHSVASGSVLSPGFRWYCYVTRLQVVLLCSRLQVVLLCHQTSSGIVMSPDFRWILVLVH